MIPQVLVQWLGLAPEDTFWEDVSTLEPQFPSLNLEDKVSLEEGSIVTRANKQAKLEVQQQRRSTRKRQVACALCVLVIDSIF